MTQEPIRTAVLGASGYTGVELIRFLLLHPHFHITQLSAERKAGTQISETFGHLLPFNLPSLVKINEIDFSVIDLVFCALPHGTTQQVIAGIPETVKIVDLSADFRLRDPVAYRQWYHAEHQETTLQKEVVYGLPEFYRTQIKSARVVANTGCFVASALLAVLPLLERQVIDPENIIIDAKSGVSGAGRAPKEGTLFPEVSEGFHAYGVGLHRHMAEMDQEFSKAAGHPVTCRFTPHLLPQNRGILSTIYLHGNSEEIHAVLSQRYQNETFVHVLPFGQVPHTRHVRGSNYVHLGVVQDRGEARTIVVSALDNLVKGASGQAIQNANILFGLDEDTGLAMVAPVFP